MERLNLLSRFGESSQLDWLGYKRIMSKPARHYFLYAVVATRSYPEGLDAAVLLLRLTEANRSRLDKEEYQTNLTFLYYFLLTVLDKMDRWEEHLRVWERLQQKTKVVSLSAVQADDPLANDDSVYADVLSLTDYRKEIIERKLERQRAGKKVGNLLHARKEELPEKEIQERLERILRWCRSGELRISTYPC